METCKNEADYGALPCTPVCQPCILMHNRMATEFGRWAVVDVAQVEIWTIGLHGGGRVQCSRRPLIRPPIIIAPVLRATLPRATIMRLHALMVVQDCMGNM